MDAKKSRLSSLFAFRRQQHSLMRIILPALCALWVATPASAANGRDFNALYRFQKAGESPGGDRERVTLGLRLFNHSENAVIRGTVVVEGTPGQINSFGSIAGVSVDEGSSVTVSGAVVIPEAEYQRWLTGNGPHLRIEYTDAAGRQVRRPIELAPGQGGLLPSGELQ